MIEKGEMANLIVSREKDGKDLPRILEPTGAAVYLVYDSTENGKLWGCFNLLCGSSEHILRRS